MNQERKSNVISIQQHQKQSSSGKVFNVVSIIKTAVLVGMVALILVLGLGIFNQIKQANTLDQKIEQAKVEKDSAEKQKETLTQQVELLQSDEYIAKLARSEYYLSKSGEIIFSTPNDTAKNKAQQAKEEAQQGETVVKVTTQNR